MSIDTSASVGSTTMVVSVCELFDRSGSRSVALTANVSCKTPAVEGVTAIRSMTAALAGHHAKLHVTMPPDSVHGASD